MPALRGLSFEWERPDLCWARAPLPGKPGWRFELAFVATPGHGWVLRHATVEPSEPGASAGQALTGAHLRSIPFTPVYAELGRLARVQQLLDDANARLDHLYEAERGHRPPEDPPDALRWFPAAPRRAGGRPRTATTDEALLDLAVAVAAHVRAGHTLTDLAAARHLSYGYLLRLIALAVDRGLLTRSKRLTTLAHRRRQATTDPDTSEEQH